MNASGSKIYEILLVIQLRMKLTFSLMLLLVVGANASGLAQKVTLSMIKAKPEQVFAEIRKQTDYRFLYSEEVIGKLAAVTINVKDASIAEVLDYLKIG